ncbi:MAG: hypothetical protein SAK29_26020 [Scytonema sp. PMC 1069.18]|nr:hypothetical protein [Scytonema sp. PMC 1069.18]MEC4881033.1 hypothetical protein [Scytonema sp. PMC 1070.18]
MNPESINQWFPVEQQHKYVSLLRGRVGVTRRRAEYFIKLWAYLLLKQQEEVGKRLQRPLTQLEIPEGFVPCTHREAYEIFYAQQNNGRGSERAAGMMIDQLVALGLIEKDFDGNSTCIRIRSLPLNPQESSSAVESVQLMTDEFNPRIDTIPVANFIAGILSLNKKTTPVPHRIAKILRSWAHEYPTGMRVLRRCDNEYPVGFYALHPTAKESEKNFFLPPRKSMFLLSSAKETDPIKIAQPGDLNCTSIYVRVWLIDTPYKQRRSITQFLEDVKQTLIRVQADFPNLCDMHTIAALPGDEHLASSVGFQKNNYNSQPSLFWMYAPIDKYLAIDIEQAVSALQWN